MVSTRLSRPLPSWKGWISRKTTTHRAMISSGCSRAVSRVLVHPGHQLRHQAGRVEGRGRLEHDTDLRAVLVEGGDAVRVGLVVAAMPGVLLAVAQQDLVQLLDVVLGERDVLPGREHQVHQLGVAGHFLLVAGGEGLDLQVRQQVLHFPVGQLAALDAGGGADALDGGHAPQGRQPVGRERAQGAPGAFELVDPGDEAQDLRGDLEGVGSQHEPKRRFTPIFLPISYTLSLFNLYICVPYTNMPLSDQVLSILSRLGGSLQFLPFFVSG